MADQLVEIVEYDPAWPARFADRHGQVSAVLAPWLAGPVEHIGSTSVPGLQAKPVVDMLAPVRSLDEAHDAVGVLEADGWLFWPDDPCRHYRLWFLRPTPAARTHHLHVIEHDHPAARALLGFRDALRADQDLRREYAQLKKDLAGQHRDNRNAYSNAKSEFIERVLRGVGIEPPSRSPLRE
ncbi:MAG TPA: GrpB family protein [Streptosporangiaceae bacterium]